MTAAVQNLLDQARKLDDDERRELVELLLHTLPPDVDAESAWGAEAHRRWQAHVASGEPAMDAFDAIDDARRRLKGKC